jgi:hypothetical protein
MQPQPFYPLTVLASLHVTAWTYNFFIIGRLFVAGVLMFFFARLFLNNLSSIVAAATFMLTGYFTIFLNMPHLSVEVLTPGMLLTFELVLRRNSWGAVAGAAGMIFLGMMGGMPESAFLSIAFACLYFVCRLLFTSEFRRELFPILGKFIAAIVLGFSLSAFLLFPFLEFLQIAHDVHQPSNVGGDKAGLIAGGDYRETIFYLLPLIFGPINNSIFLNYSGWTGMKSYWGIVPCILAVAAIFSMFARRRVAHPKGFRFLTAFFLTTLVLMILKKLGHPIINWIGELPVSEMVLYAKYQEPLMALCVAMLAGIGFSQLSERRAGWGNLAMAAVAVLGVMLALALPYWHPAGLLQKTRFFYYFSFAAGVTCLLVAASLMIWFVLTKSLRTGQWLVRGICLLLCLELAVSYVVPMFYILGANPPPSRSPYNGAPFVGFLRARNTDHSRMFGRESLLFPNWSAAFELADVRALDAVYYRRYLAFIRNFLLSPGDNRRHGDLADRFTGSEFAFEFDTESEKRFLALSSVRYLLTASEYGSSSKVVDAILRQHQGENIWGFGPSAFRVGGESGTTVRGLLQHPPSRRISLKTVIDPQSPIFEAIAVIKSDVAERTDGAGFQIEIKDGDTIVALFSTFINPRDVPDDKAGRPVRLDLSQYAGREVELLFSTDPGPSGNNAFDWAGWAKPQFVAKSGAVSLPFFTRIYSKEAEVYEVPGTLPRATLFGAVEILPDSEVLGRLKDPAFKSDEKVVLARESLSGIDPAVLRPLVEGTSAPYSAARIVIYQSQRVEIEANAGTSALLMLTDANYPGWSAYVNGQRVPVFAANYLFRGVIVPAGKSTVEFVYEPVSFRLGGAISIAALLALGGLLFRERKRHLRASREI